MKAVRLGPLILLALTGLCYGETVEGKLVQHEGKPPVLEAANHKIIALEGDKSTEKVLNDVRLADADMELNGHFTGSGAFAIDPFHTRAMRVHKDGKRLIITYWCDVCSIRTYTPGPCWCCQRYTALDLRESAEE